MHEDPGVRGCRSADAALAAQPASGADPVKLARQIAQYSSAIQDMPVPWVYRGTDEALMIYDGVTRATRVAELLPGTLIRVEVVGKLPAACGHLPTIGD